MYVFRQSVDSVKLFDLGFISPSFIWSNWRLGQGRVMERLDQVFVNFAWKLIFPKGKVMHGISAHSNHLPLNIAWNSKPHGTRFAEPIFRFESLWTEQKECWEMVERVWDRPITDGTQVIPQFMNHLRDLQSELLMWDRITFCNLPNQIYSAEARVRTFFDLQPSDDLS